MRESITIRNFGPIREIELEDIRPLTVFVGKSGSGKSTILKTVALFRWIFKMVCIRSFLSLSGVSNSGFSFDFPAMLKKDGMSEYIKNDTEIAYQKGDCHIFYSKASGLKVENIDSWENISLEKISFISDKRNMIPEIILRNGDQANLNFFLRESLKDYKKAVEFVKSLNLQCLGVNFNVVRGDNGRLKYRILGEMDGEKYSINLTDSSSGTQTVTPLSVIIEYFTRHYDVVENLNKSIFKLLSISDRLSQFKGQQDVGSIESKMVSFLIEEPELSLYPSGQCQLIDFIIEACFGDVKRDCCYSVMLATHSPYIVNHLNLLTAKASKNITDSAHIPLSDVDVFEICDGYINDLKQDNIFDTRLLSEPIEDIYNQYNEIIGL